MAEKAPISPDRVRRIAGSFAFIEHRFLRDGFFDSLTHHELVLYIFLVLAGDRNGVSFYSYDRICAHLLICLDDYIEARNSLIRKDLVAFDGTFFQVLSLPNKLSESTEADICRRDPATVRSLINQALYGEKND